MKDKIAKILQEFWGYNSFRPLQEDIILSVLSGKDTLALLPTGGGKSITFQVPALAKEGICIVVTPLIALMKDQVENLKKRQIKAIALHSGMNQYEINIALNNCVYDNIKFLYVSPERISTDTFKHYLEKMNVNLLAIDESHCISQWGYDFRPPYLKIADIRKYIPDVPVIAVTATATPIVVDDIMQKLNFKEKNVFRQSFYRDNLVYNAIKEENKEERLLHLLNEVKGTAIIYVRSRKKTKDIAEFLYRNKISSGFYHAGLDPIERDKRQQQWISGNMRVMVATNAFGMGIDKPDVRLVVHLDIPDNIEAYFQEAGRGGRDGKISYAWLLWSEANIIDSKHNLETSFPDPSLIKNVYNALGNYFQLALGNGEMLTFDFEISDFCKFYNLPPLETFYALKILEKENLIILSEAIYNPSKIKILMDKIGLYQFQLQNPKLDSFIQMILRSYSGIFNDFVKIDEFMLARRMNIEKQSVINGLSILNKCEVLSYIPANNKPKITFVCERLNAKNIQLSNENYYDRKKIAEERLESMIKYVKSQSKCRSQILLEYFGEKESKKCGICDVCEKRSEIGLNKYHFDAIVEKIKPILNNNSLSFKELMQIIDTMDSERAIKAIRWLIDNGKIVEDNNYKFSWKK